MVCFLSSWLPLLWGGHNFLNFNPFLTIFHVPDAPIEKNQVLFGHQKHQSPPLESGLPWVFKWSLMDCSTLLQQISVHTAHGSMIPIVNKQLSVNGSWLFIASSSKNQEMTKIAFVSFQVYENFQQKFTLKYLP